MKNAELFISQYLILLLILLSFSVSFSVRAKAIIESYGWRENYSVTSGLRHDLTTKVSINTEWQIMELIGDKENNSGQFTAHHDNKQTNIMTFIVNFIF